MSAFFFFLVALVSASPAPFDDVIKSVVERSTRVQKTRAEWEGTKFRNWSRGGLLFLPTLKLEGRYGFEKSALLGTQGSVLSAEAVADYNLFHFGADLASIRASSNEIRSKEFSLAGANLVSEEEGVTAAILYLSLRLQKDVLARLVQMRETTIRVAETRYKKGQLAAEEVDKVKIDRDNAAQSLSDNEAELARSKAALEAFAGPMELEVRWPWRKYFESLPRWLLEKTSPDLSSRPDWQAATLDLKAVEDRASEAWGDMLPRLDARFSYGAFQFQSDTTKYSPGWTAGVVLSVPLFDRFEKIGRYGALSQGKLVSEAALEQVRRDARREWEGSEAGFRISLKNAQEREETLGRARRVFEANLERFNRGIASVNDLRVDQERLYQTELLLIRGWAQVHTDLRRLCHAAGWRIEKCLENY